MADKALSWSYTEDYLREDPVLEAARLRASELGCVCVSPGAGSVLRLLAASLGANAVLELGTGVGVSGLWALSGMGPTGVLTTIDIEAEFHKVAKSAFAQAGVAPARTRIITGRALDVLPRMAPNAYDMAIVDTEACEAQSYVEHLERILRPGGLAVFLHALWFDHVADPARREPDTVAMRELVKSFRDNDNWMPTLLPSADGILVALKR
ncbi:MAG: O-methyltransferase [Actinomycetaceae bacterium]|nr:O-methyltransferase [Actinomycetaceae bacterium]